METEETEEAYAFERRQLLFSSSWLLPCTNVCSVVPEKSEM